MHWGGYSTPSTREKAKILAKIVALPLWVFAVSIATDSKDNIFTTLNMFEPATQTAPQQKEPASSDNTIHSFSDLIQEKIYTHPEADDNSTPQEDSASE